MPLVVAVGSMAFNGTETRPSGCFGLKCTPVLRFGGATCLNLTLSCGLESGDDVGLRLKTWLPDPRIGVDNISKLIFKDFIEARDYF